MHQNLSQDVCYAKLLILDGRPLHTGMLSVVSGKPTQLSVN